MSVGVGALEDLGNRLQLFHRNIRPPGGKLQISQGEVERQHKQRELAKSRTRGKQCGFKLAFSAAKTAACLGGGEPRQQRGRSDARYGSAR